jgi:hypothetical protein
MQVVVLHLVAGPRTPVVALALGVSRVLRLGGQRPPRLRVDPGR